MSKTIKQNDNTLNSQMTLSELQNYMESHFKQCAYCGKEYNESLDSTEHQIWICENSNCEKEFCSQCFIDRYGSQTFYDMTKGVHSEEKILCPHCYEESKRE